MLYEKLNYLIAIAEEQNLTQAAKRLFISQPALTLYLNRLEAELGVKLFNRSKSPITPTEAGLYYLDKMKKIYASEQELRSELHFIANPTLSLRIGIGQVRGHHWLPQILPTFCSMRPDVNIQIIQRSEELMFHELKQQQLDIVIGCLPSDPNITSVDLVPEQLVFAAHKKFFLIPEHLRSDHDYDHPYTIQPSQLDGLPFIIPNASNGLYNNYYEIMQSNKITPSRTISFNNLNTGLLLNIQGFGVQLIVSTVLHFAHEPGMENLDFFRLENMPQTRMCVAAFQENSLKKKLIEDFIRTVQNVIVLPQSHII